MRFNNIKSAIERREFLIASGGFLLFSATLCAYAIWVQHSEAFIYYWDYTTFWQLARSVAQALQIGPVDGIRSWVSGIDRDGATTTFALPISVMMAAIGLSREVFVVSMETIFGTLFAYSCWCLLRRLSAHDKSDSVRLLLITFIVSFCTPVVHGLAIRGYPDITASCAVILAASVFLSDSRLDRSRTLVLVGFFLAVAIACRRHFVYTVFSFWLILFIWVIRDPVLSYLFRRSSFRWPKVCWRDLLPVVKVGIIVLINVSIVVCLMFNVISNAIHNPKSVLYSAYETSAYQSVWKIANVVGVLNLFFGTLGYLLAARGRASAILFIPALTAVWVCVWMLYVRQQGFHYATDAVLVYVVLGEMLFLNELVLSRYRAGRFCAAAFVGFLIVQFASCNLSPKLGQKLESSLGSIWGASFYPLQRPDYYKLRELVGRLRTDGDLSRNILVAASSVDFNVSTFQEGELQLFPERPPKLNFVTNTNVDGRDPSIISGLLAAQTIVVVIPPQYHLDPKFQRNVAFAVRHIVDDSAYSQHFELVMKFPKFIYDLELRVLKRVSPFTRVEANELIESARRELGEEIVRKESFFVVDSEKPWSNFGKGGVGFESVKYSGLELSSGHNRVIPNPLLDYKVVKLESVGSGCSVSFSGVYRSPYDSAEIVTTRRISGKAVGRLHVEEFGRKLVQVDVDVSSDESSRECRSMVEAL